MYPNAVRTCHHPKITWYCRNEADCEANITDFHCGWCIFSGIFLVYVSFVFDTHSFKLNWNYNFDFHSIALLGFDGNSNSCPFNFPTSYDVKKRIESVYVNHQAYLCKLFESLEWVWQLGATNIAAIWVWQHMDWIHRRSNEYQLLCVAPDFHIHILVIILQNRYNSFLQHTNYRHRKSLLQ